MSITTPTQQGVSRLPTAAHLRTNLLNGNVRIASQTGSTGGQPATYEITGGSITTNVKVALPDINSDDTLVTQNSNVTWGGGHTFNRGLISNGPISAPVSVVSDSFTASGGTISTASTANGQTLGFFGNSPIARPSVTTSGVTGKTMVQDMWNGLIGLGLLSSAAGGGNPTFPGGPVPVAASGRFGSYQVDNSSPSGSGLYQSMGVFVGGTSFALTTVNNRRALSISGSTSTAGIGIQGFPVVLGQNPTASFKASMSTNTAVMGLGYVSAAPGSFTTLSAVLASQSGIIIGFNSGDTHYSVVTNNGSASATSTATSVSLVSAGSAALFTLAWTTSNSTLTWTIQTGASTSTSGTINTGNLPASTTPVEPCAFFNATGAALRLEHMDIALANDTTSSFP